MRVVEFLGPPGSGKTKLAAGLTERFPHLVSLPEAVRRRIGQSGEDRVTRLVARLTRSADGKLWGAAYGRSADRFSALHRFVAAHPETLETVLKIQRFRAGRDLHPEMVLGWMLNLMARYQFCIEADDPGWLVVDEGFAQRGVALLAGGYVEDDLSLIDGYLDRMPGSDVVVVMDTPIETCIERLDRGGWSERLRLADSATRRRFIESSDQISRHIASVLKGMGLAVIWVSGTTPAPESVDLIAATLAP